MAGSLNVAALDWRGAEWHTTEASPDGRPIGMAVLRGCGELVTGRDAHAFAAGEVSLVPHDEPFTFFGDDCEFAIVQVPWAAVADLAAEHAELPEGELRFASMGPLSPDQQQVFTSTVRFLRDQMVGSGAGEIHPLVIQELTGVAAAALLETFPNTAMTACYLRGAGWVPPAAVRAAAEFIEAHAGQPLTTTQIAAAAGVSALRLQHAFHRHLDTTVTGYLRRVRLERARQELAGAAPGDGRTVEVVAARWGWVSPAQFVLAYHRRFGVSPGDSLDG
jgi:AraC-like DNA-binding protein